MMMWSEGDGEGVTLNDSDFVSFSGALFRSMPNLSLFLSLHAFISLLIYSTSDSFSYSGFY